MKEWTYRKAKFGGYHVFVKYTNDRFWHFHKAFVVEKDAQAYVTERNHDNTLSNS